MSYWPAIIEYVGWGLPYIFIALAVWIAWPAVKGLRGDEIRSVCVVTMVFVVAYSLGQFDEDRTPWHDPMWLLAIVGMVTIALISWGAQYAKLKFAEYELELNRKALSDPERAPPPAHPLEPQDEDDGLFDLTEDMEVK